LDCIGPHVQRAPQQQFYDLLGALQVPQKTILATQEQTPQV